MNPGRAAGSAERVKIPPHYCGSTQTNKMVHCLEKKRKKKRRLTSESIHRNHFPAVVASSRVHYYLLSSNQRGGLLGCVAQYLHVLINHCGSFVFFTPITIGHGRVLTAGGGIRNNPRHQREKERCGTRNFHVDPVESERFQKPDEPDAC